MSAAKAARRVPAKRREGERRRARARSRALVRLAREYADRYRQLYAEELGSVR